MITRITVAAAMLPLLTGSPVQAACPQELAVYSDGESSVSLEFRPVVEAAATTANAFRMLFADMGLVLDGVVIWNNGVARPNGIITHDCPEGDATGAELDACTIWQGVVYTIAGDGAVDLLPPQGEAAAARILLPDIGRAVRYSPIYGDKTGNVPWDVFDLSGCQE